MFENNKVELEQDAELKDQEEVAKEVLKIKTYKKLLIIDRNYNPEVQSFILATVEKYRYKLEVMNYYNNVKGQDNIYDNQYNTLIALKNMIFQYASIKFGTEFCKNLFGE